MDADVVIIGMGVVGLACASSLARAGYSTICVERHDSFGQETSSRNSEVIHSGVYYPAGSLKARMCVSGNKSSYQECARLNVWHKRCGKLIVAVTQAEEGELEKLYRRGLANGVEGMEMISGARAGVLEPHIRCLSALQVASSGILDSHELMKAYLHEATEHGATCVFGVAFVAPEKTRDGYTLQMKDTTGEKIEISARCVVNSAGLAADKVARAFGIDIVAAGYRLYPNRGHYFRVSTSKSRLVTRLVYPIPPSNLPGLGIHITIDKAGQCKLGPDAEYLEPPFSEETWYAFDPDEAGRKEKFYKAVSRYFPALEPEDLSPDQVGVRPKLQPPGEPMRDFIIADESARGLPGLINLMGIESPGLTCAHEIANEVLGMLRSYD